MRNKFRILLTVLLSCICVGSNAASPMVRRLMELPPFERAVLIIKYYETFIARNTGRPSVSVMSYSRANRTVKAYSLQKVRLTLYSERTCGNFAPCTAPMGLTVSCLPA